MERERSTQRGEWDAERERSGERAESAAHSPLHNVYSSHSTVCRLLIQSSLLLFSERELTFTFAIGRRRSVCRLSSVVCRLSVVCNVRAPYSGD